MALFTGKGDNGTTKTYRCDQRISKSSAIAEALGSMDEINSFLGLCKMKSEKEDLDFDEGGPSFSEIIHGIQQTLFSIQAELAGFPKKIEEDKVKELEKIINGIETQLPPIKTFFISGGTELAAMFDFARTLARRAERRVVGVKDEGKVTLGAPTLAYMNRLSSVLYALARLSNHKADIAEESPSYK